MPYTSPAADTAIVKRGRSPEIFSTTFRIDEKYIKSSSNFKNIKKWDSLNHVKLILAIESKFKIPEWICLYRFNFSKFKISIKPDDSVELLSYKEILNYLQKIWN